MTSRCTGSSEYRRCDQRGAVRRPGDCIQVPVAAVLPALAVTVACPDVLSHQQPLFEKLHRQKPVERGLPARFEQDARPSGAPPRGAATLIVPFWTSLTDVMLVVTVSRRDAQTSRRTQNHTRTSDPVVRIAY